MDPGVMSRTMCESAPTTSKLTSMHFYSWKQVLKTGCYYLRTRPADDAIQFTVDTTVADKANKENVKPSSSTAPQFQRSMSVEDEEMKAMHLAAAKLACSLQNKEACTMCSS